MRELVTSCCGKEIGDCAGCHQNMQLIDKEEYKKRCKSRECGNNVVENSYLNSILHKIEMNTITMDDFNILMMEATPASVVDRVRRKTNPLNKRKRSRSIGDFKVSARVQPSRKRANRTQMQHGGKQGHRHSERTQKRQNKYTEAVLYIRDHIGKPIQESDMPANDIPLIKKVACKLMSYGNVNRDWLFELLTRINHVRD